MKAKCLLMALLFALGIGLTSCVTHRHAPPRHHHHYDRYDHHHHHKGKKVPPGHAKKMTGNQSARDYAPGHRK